MTERIRVKTVATLIALAFFEPTFSPTEVEEAMCLTEIVHYESNGEGYSGKKAVANVALTRAEPNLHFPDSICGVLEHEGAFEHRNYGKDLDDIRLTEPDDRESFSETLALVRMAMEGRLSDNTQGADHFFNPDLSNPGWASNPLSVVDIGNHRFVKLYP